MKKLVYSPQYKRKLTEIKKYLDFHFGTDVRKKTLRTITDRLHLLQSHEESGVSLRKLYGINTDYRYVFVAHNYIFYRIDVNCIRVLNIYNEHEDYMQDLFGIQSIDDDAARYWEEVERLRRNS